MKGMAITRNPTNFNKFQFLNRETQFETGYIDLIHRQFDPTIARFISQDPVIEGQEHLSLYQYSWNNPILKSDPDGDCPNCLTALGGALLKGGIELGGQLLSGKSLNEVDWADVGVEAVKGINKGLKH
jgi:RHS repeat-associated protein